MALYPDDYAPGDPTPPPMISLRGLLIMLIIIAALVAFGVIKTRGAQASEADFLFLLQLESESDDEPIPFVSPEVLAEAYETPLDKTLANPFGWTGGYDPTRDAGAQLREIDAHSQPTPWPGVAAVLAAVKPQPGDVVWDPGCGADARLLIRAALDYDVQRLIGTELNPDNAEAARRAVADAGLSDRIEIITGDAATAGVKADVVIGYMWRDVWRQIWPAIEASGAKRVATYYTEIPGVPMQRIPMADGASVHVWTRPPATTRVPVYRTYRAIAKLPAGSHCEVCGGRCRNPMAHVTRQQIVGYKTVPTSTTTPAAAPAAPRGHWETRSQRVCRQGAFGRRYCQNIQTRVWIPE